MAAITFLGVLQNKYGGECQITVVAMLFPAMSCLHSGFSPLKNSILVGFYSYFSGRNQESFITRFYKGTLEKDAANTVSYFSLLSHDLLVGLFFLQELWMLQQKYRFSTL